MLTSNMSAAIALPSGDHAADVTGFASAVSCVRSGRPTSFSDQSWLFHTKASVLPSGLAAGAAAGVLTWSPSTRDIERSDPSVSQMPPRRHCVPIMSSRPSGNHSGELYPSNRATSAPRRSVTTTKLPHFIPYPPSHTVPEPTDTKATRRPLGASLGTAHVRLLETLKPLQ